MELIFICPVRNREFSTSRWWIPHSLTAVSDHKGGKRLQGNVEAFCPYCNVFHEFEPDQIPCPLKSERSSEV